MRLFSILAVLALTAFGTMAQAQEASVLQDIQSVRGALSRGEVIDLNAALDIVIAADSGAAPGADVAARAIGARAMDERNYPVAVRAFTFAFQRSQATPGADLQRGLDMLDIGRAALIQGDAPTDRVERLFLRAQRIIGGVVAATPEPSQELWTAYLRARVWARAGELAANARGDSVPVESFDPRPSHRADGQAYCRGDLTLARDFSYPGAERIRGAQGVVGVWMRLEPDGRVLEARVLASVPEDSVFSRMVEEALQSVQVVRSTNDTAECVFREETNIVFVFKLD